MRYKAGFRSRARGAARSVWTFGPCRLCRRNDEATTEMANIPQKSKDATEEALTAIQEALSLRQQGEAPPVTADLFPDEQPSRRRAAPRRQ